MVASNGASLGVHATKERAVAHLAQYETEQVAAQTVAVVGAAPRPFSRRRPRARQMSLPIPETTSPTSCDLATRIATVPLA